MQLLSVSNQIIWMPQCHIVIILIIQARIKLHLKLLLKLVCVIIKRVSMIVNTKQILLYFKITTTILFENHCIKYCYTVYYQPCLSPCNPAAVALTARPGFYLDGFWINTVWHALKISWFLNLYFTCIRMY